ncbi:MAG: MurR/RpiR family transcriptional regulator [Actinomycetota bacterium]|nr:MurR/RpiR family transcriptional regulator [Actinomycetota bacterium]
MVAADPSWPSEPFSTRLLEQMDTLTASEKRVARAILADYPLAGLDSVTSLSSKAGVSAPTVLRLATKFGFSGWPQFQAELREEVSQRLASPLSMYSQVRSAPKPSAGVRGGSVLLDALEGTLERLKPEVLNSAVEMLIDPRARVYVIGGRFSSALAVYLATHLQMVRPQVTSVSEIPSLRSNVILDLGRKDVVVAFDFRRYQRDTIEFGSAAAERGARVILFTDPWLSPLVSSARLVLTVKTASPSAFDSFVPALAVLELLLHRIAESMGQKSLDRMRAHDDLNRAFMLGSEDL